MRKYIEKIESIATSMWCLNGNKRLGPGKVVEKTDGFFKALKSDDLKDIRPDSLGFKTLIGYCRDR